MYVWQGCLAIADEVTDPQNRPPVQFVCHEGAISLRIEYYKDISFTAHCTRTVICQKGMKKC